jgi:hypothetical protein
MAGIFWLSWSLAFFVTAGFIAKFGDKAMLRGRHSKKNIAKLTLAAVVELLLILLALSFGSHDSGREKQARENRAKVFFEQRVQAFTDYLQGKEIDIEDAWWLDSNRYEHQPESIRLFLQANTDRFLPIINEGREKKYDGPGGVEQWWKDEGRKKLLYNYTIKLKSEVSPPVAEQAKQVSEETTGQ